MVVSFFNIVQSVKISLLSDNMSDVSLYMSKYFKLNLETISY